MTVSNFCLSVNQHITSLYHHSKQCRQAVAIVTSFTVLFLLGTTHYLTGARDSRTPDWIMSILHPRERLKKKEKEKRENYLNPHKTNQWRRPLKRTLTYEPPSLANFFITSWINSIKTGFFLTFLNGQTWNRQLWCHSKDTTMPTLGSSPVLLLPGGIISRHAL